MEPIEITDIRLARMEPDQMTPLMAQSGVSWYLLTLKLRNRSNEPIHVISDIRRIKFDEGRRVLIVQLSEHEAPSDTPVATPPLPPQFRLISPGEETTVVHPLSSPITFLEISSDGTRQPRNVRLTEDVDTIECTIAYETDPPAPVVDLTASKIPNRWRGRGTIVTASRRISPVRDDDGGLG
jgi:hypothetical protein